MGSIRVLIVEDDPVMALHLETLVAERCDAAVVVAGSVEEAKTRLDPRPDLALLDIDVTDGKTFEIAERLMGAHVPFAFVSASRKEQVPSALAGVPFLEKPYEEEAIRDLLAELKRRPKS